MPQKLEYDEQKVDYSKGCYKLKNLHIFSIRGLGVNILICISNLLQHMIYD